MIRQGPEGLGYWPDADAAAPVVPVIPASAA